MPPSRQKPQVERYERLALFVLLLTALIIRLVFFSGLSSLEDLANAQRIQEAANLLRSNSQNLFSSLSEIRQSTGGIQNLVSYAPYLVFHWLFGVSVFSSLFLSVICSLANIFLIYSIAKRFFSPSVGLISACLWAFFPLDITFSTSMLMATPLVFLFLLSVWLFLEGRGKKRVRLQALALGIAVLLFIIEPWLALCLGSFLLWLQFSESKTIHRFFPVLGFTAVLVLFILGKQLGDAFLQIYHTLQIQGESLLILSLFFVATATILQRDLRAAKLPLLLLGLVMVGLLGKIISLGSVDLQQSDLGPFLLFLFLPPYIIFGVYFAHRLDKNQAPRWVFYLSLIAILGAGLAVLGAREFLPSYKDLNWIGLHSLFPLFSILTGLAFAGILASPWFLAGSKQLWKERASFALLIIIILGGLPFAWDRRDETRYFVEGPAAAWDYLIQSDQETPIFTLSQETQQRFAFLASMSPKDQAVSSEQISFEDTSKISEGIILAFEDELPTIPSIWVRLSAFGPLGQPRVIAYQVRSNENAQEALLGIDESTPLEYYITASNAGLFCNSYQAWRLSQRELDQISSIPVSPEADCFQQNENLINLEDLVRSENISGYITFDRTNLTENEQASLSMRQVTLPVLNQRTSGVSINLKANTLYLYQVEIQTNGESAVLFWKEDRLDDYLEMRAYPDWTTVALLLLTPDWPEGERAVYFSPVLFDHVESVSLRNLLLAEVDLKQ